MKPLILAAALTALFVTGAAATVPRSQEQQLSPADVQALKDFIQSLKASHPAAVAKPAAPVSVIEPAAPSPAPVVVGPPAPAPVAPAAIPAPPVTQNTVATTGPVSSETTISVGTLAGQALAWIMVTFSVPIGGIGVWIMSRVLQNLKIPMTDSLRAKLQEMAVNALNVNAPIVAAELAGQGQIAIKNETMARSVAYVQKHGADTIKKLGNDPTSQEAIEAIKARLETAIADPTVPTPAILDPAKAAPVVPTAVPATPTKV